tara:strand:- start:24 stop:668 length:645 start_codon:yes stop_codon:yes gene_type:complete
VQGFYSDRAKAGELRVLSNFYTHDPYPYAIPAYCGAAALVATGRASRVELPFAEKGIMLCKAATMGDYAAYDRILMAALPTEAKSLGRGVQPWDQARWDAVVCGVGASVVRAKFASVPGLAKLLRATGDTLLAEATRNDQVWGVGVDLGDPALANPRRWRGTNVLGWSLMEARSSLGGAGVPGSAAAAGDAGRGKGKAVARNAPPPIKPKRQKS